MLIDVTRLMAWVIVMLARDFLLACLIAMAVLIDVARFVARMIVMLTGFILGHVVLP
ncbi:hypothetical protein [Rhodopseudomonas sp. AAP120]|uniref:hypothetical protein n=1 Tax=Rhodopseudomonas sp. AAP120 TaxID=1523430 RepID=UPI0018D04820|nr:hypothetical protein [Rhodopseudomonas sp. AAP120]MBS4005967.1 hypothetical protein [Afipia sp.]